MQKYRISWVKKNRYNVLSYTEEFDEVYVEVVFTGNLLEAENYIKQQRNVKV